MIKDDMIELNVGGKIFMTSKETAKKSTFLDATIQRWTGPEDKVIYIDKDPKTFEWVLNIMRDEVSLADVPENKNMKDRVKAQLDYFCVDVYIPENTEKPFIINKGEPDLIFGASYSQSYNLRDIVPLKKGDKLLWLDMYDIPMEFYKLEVKIKVIGLKGYSFPLKEISISDGKQIAKVVQNRKLTIPLNITIIGDGSTLVVNGISTSSYYFKIYYGS